MNELNYIISSILGDLKKVLDNAGIYYRIFARQKTNGSIKKSWTRKQIHIEKRIRRCKTSLE